MMGSRRKGLDDAAFGNGAATALGAYAAQFHCQPLEIRNLALHPVQVFTGDAVHIRAIPVFHRLRALLALNLAAAAAGSMVIVNTVIYVRDLLARPNHDVALALALFGGGSMLAALILPRVLERLPDRPVMISGAAMLALGLLSLGALSLRQPAGWSVLLGVWFILGLGYSTVLTPSGRLLRRSARQADRPALFAAQFALSHACWLLTYPLAGWLGAEAGMTTALITLGGLTALGAALAPALWPRQDPEVVEHIHEDLAPGHPHVQDAKSTERGFKHAHALVIDDDHRHWPR